MIAEQQHRERVRLRVWTKSHNVFVPFEGVELLRVLRVGSRLAGRREAASHLPSLVAAAWLRGFVVHGIRTGFGCDRANVPFGF